MVTLPEFLVRCRRADLTLNQATVLALLRAGPRYMVELRHDGDFRVGTLARAVNYLIAQGLVEKQKIPAPSDTLGPPKSALITLTFAGQRLFEAGQ